MKSEYHSIEDLPLVVKVDDLAPILGIGRNTAYELVRCGQIRSIHIGRKIHVPRDAIVEFINGPKK